MFGTLYCCKMKNDEYKTIANAPLASIMLNYNFKGMNQ